MEKIDLYRVTIQLYNTPMSDQIEPHASDRKSRCYILIMVTIAIIIFIAIV